MPQIAQQDYIKLEIANTSNLTEAEKEVIKKHIDNGTIWDIIISENVDTETVFYRVVGLSKVDNEVYLGGVSIRTMYYGE